MDVNNITGEIIDAAMKVHTELGPGLLESAYRHCLLFELHRRGFEAAQEVELPIVYCGVTINAGYRLDLLVEDAVIVECKAVKEFARVHEAQLLSYLKLSNKKVGLLLNFHSLRLKDGIKRIVN